MHVLFFTVLISLAAGPHAQETNIDEELKELTSLMPLSTVPTELTESVTNGNHVTTAEDLKEDEDRTLGDTIANNEDKFSTMGSLTTEDAEEQTMTFTPELLTTPVSTVVPETATMVNTEATTSLYEATTLSAPPPEFTTLSEQEETTVENLVITELPQRSSPSPTHLLSAPTTVITTPTLSSSDEPSEETTHLLPTITSTSNIVLTPTTSQISESTHQPKDFTTTSVEMSSTIIDTKLLGDKSSLGSENSKNWLIIGLIALVIFCILTTFCVIAVILRHRKKSGKQNFGYMNGRGQKSKKKKGAEDDVWAGPVKLGGGDCEGPEEGDAQGVDKKTDGTEVMLSTFVAVEENGGVGRPGSEEVHKWEEQEHLMYIDEEAKAEGKEKEGAEEAKEAGKTDKTEAEENGGETFCLTTAV